MEGNPGLVPPSELCDTEEKKEAYRVVCENLPKYVQTLKNELLHNGPGQPSAAQMIPGANGGDPQSFRNLLIPAISKLAPP